MTDLNPSKLGTKEYWDRFYDLEKRNFKENSDDTGECWFSDSGAEERMVEFLVTRSDEGVIDEQSASVIDLGTGNGRLLFSLREGGYEGPMLGIDYSEPSVEFARMVAQNEEHEDIHFQQADFLTDGTWNKDNQKWDIVMDKGTLDAIALSDAKYEGKTGVERYPEMVRQFIKDSGSLLVTSCNFTEDELIKSMTKDGLFKLNDRVHYPTFQFGGVQGSTICTIEFKPL
ncbi:hypothetical protein TRICI_005498 [Trichomonascus ciferrii]|uniref:Protein-lysine N-methyltransferase EFM4 n=1 Tax=Trichomonascus ciferrii TaxID=44093 RepID=A0A642USC8_9ASCO|nr:hypothetical protein TRICI_005498 [Trichomonascus ciferrii]